MLPQCNNPIVRQEAAGYSPLYRATERNDKRSCHTHRPDSVAPRALGATHPLTEPA